MGRRSRSRSRADEVGRAPRPATDHTPGSRSAGLPPERRALAALLGGVVLVGVLTLVCIVALGGGTGPWLTLALVVTASGLLVRVAQRRLEGVQLADEDRVLQTLGGGILLICVLLAVANLVLFAVA